MIIRSRHSCPQSRAPGWPDRSIQEKTALGCLDEISRFKYFFITLFLQDKLTKQSSS